MPYRQPNTGTIQGDLVIEQIRCSADGSESKRTEPGKDCTSSHRRERYRGTESAGWEEDSDSDDVERDQLRLGGRPRPGVEAGGKVLKRAEGV